MVQNVVDDENVPAHARPEQITVLDQRLIALFQVFLADDLEAVDALRDDGGLLRRHHILLFLIYSDVRLDSRLSFPSMVDWVGLIRNWLLLVLRDQGHDVLESLGAASGRLSFFLGPKLTFYADDTLDVIRGETAVILLAFLTGTEQKRE